MMVEKMIEKMTIEKKIIIEKNRLKNANYLPSPNFDLRPPTKITLIVIHNISLPPGEFRADDICDFFTNRLDFRRDPYFQKIRKMRVSAHLLIARNGRITQFVDFDKRAWHAGESAFKGRERCNDFSIGIELVGSDNIAYTEAQYRILKMALAALKSHYPIEAVVGHSDISPGRKTDPGPFFDWGKINEKNR